ncbi:MAG: TrkA family potassium uptake protein [Pirellulales bacterium]
MITPLQRIRYGASFLGIITVVSVVGHYQLSGRSLLESIYWFVITVSSVGYTEQSRIPATLQAFSILVIVVGMSAVAYTVGGLIQLMTEGEIERALGLRRMTREIDQLGGHIIICGFGRIGQILAEEFSRSDKTFVVIDTEGERIAEARILKYLVITGNATEEETLIAAGIARASTLISGLNSDAGNVFLTLTSRNLNPDLQIIARGEQPSSEKKLIQAGANRVVLPAVIGAQRIATMVTRPHAADVIDQVTDRRILDVELEEIAAGDSESLVGKTVRDADANRRHRLLIVAVRKRDGKMIFNPEADYQIAAGDTMIVMGRPDDIRQFRQATTA